MVSVDCVITTRHVTQSQEYVTTAVCLAFILIKSTRSVPKVWSFLCIFFQLRKIIKLDDYTDSVLSWSTVMSSYYLS